jgi:beta-galactosidase
MMVSTAHAQQPNESQTKTEEHKVTIYSDDQGSILIANGRPFFVQGMNWGYMPVGENYSYDFWGQSESFIKTVLDREMSMLQSIGINAIRQYAGIPPSWVEYIHTNYGIYTMINPLVGRYGIDVDGVFIPVTNYEDPKIRATIKQQTLDVVQQYKETQGILLWLLGNENNYGLHWSSFEIEALPTEEQGSAKAKFLYSLYGELIDAIHEIDSNHPVSIANGDVQYIDLIAEYCPNLDILGSNVYRGVSARDLYKVVEQKLDIPVMYTEFGADAYDAKRMREDSQAQAYYLKEQWKELYLQSYNKEGVGNAIGGFTFQWSDGWWKYLQESNLDVHDTNASWPNGGYPLDYVEGQNNMNEEWFGITAKSLPDQEGHYDVYWRPAAYVLQDIYKLPVYHPAIDPEKIEAHFNNINPNAYTSTYQAEYSQAEQKEKQRFGIKDARVELSFIGSKTPEYNWNMDHMESVYTTIEANPVGGVHTEIDLNILGNVAENPIDELFYEGRGRKVMMETEEGESISWTDRDRLALYRIGINWNNPDFEMHTFYRDGHYHWGDEGDFFHFYQEANYGPSIDIYQANVPIGAEFTFKKKFDGLKLAVGPQLYWGANPSAIVKYHKQRGPWEYALMVHSDIAGQGNLSTSNVIPQLLNQRASLYLKRSLGNVDLEIGALSSGLPRVGQTFQYVELAQENEQSYRESGYHLLQDTLFWGDTLGAKAKLTGTFGSLRAYTQGGYQGILADGGADATLTFTGWRLKEPGRGNNIHALGGIAYTMGDFQFAPNFLYQKPLIGPLPYLEGGYDPLTGQYSTGTDGRNVLHDPFQVIENRETIAAEFLITYDTVPGSWFWQWNNDVRERAPFAGAIGLVYRHQPTIRDSRIGFNEYENIFAFPTSPPAQDVWEINARALWTKGKNRIITNSYLGTAQSRGVDERLLLRAGFDARAWYELWRAECIVKFNDWGPFDYHQDYNLTFPFQITSDLSYGIKAPRYDRNNPRIGIRAKYRTIDQYSPEPMENGYEYEVRSYVHFGL